jgi:hypothetical protein
MPLFYLFSLFQKQNNMNRRRFFKSSGLALAAIAGLPRGLKSQVYADSRVYKNDFDKNPSGTMAV